MIVGCECNVINENAQNHAFCSVLDIIQARIDFALSKVNPKIFVV